MYSFNAESIKKNYKGIFEESYKLISKYGHATKEEEINQLIDEANRLPEKFPHAQEMMEMFAGTVVIELKKNELVYDPNKASIMQTMLVKIWDWFKVSIGATTYEDWSYVLKQLTNTIHQFDGRPEYKFCSDLGVAAINEIEKIDKRMQAKEPLKKAN